MPIATAIYKNRWALILTPLAAIAFLLLKPSAEPESPTPPNTHNPAPSKPSSLAALGLPPDWSELDRFQNTISWPTFLDRLETIYTKDDSWQQWITVDPDKKQASIGKHTLTFSEEDQPSPGSSFTWKARSDLNPARPLPLTGLKIAIDPGHIGGEYAAIEKREHRWGETIIREGSMTLRTAQILAPLLEELGASVTLVRSKLEPVTKKEASDFPDAQLFYRTSEIRARAHLVNNFIQPDLVICLHFNGSSATFREFAQHFHLILNGTYTAEELAHEDERFQMLQRLLSGTITEELPLAQEIAGAFNDLTNLPAYHYPDNSRTSQKLANHPNIWARNLLANRLYQCPVIFLEPYVMNSIPFIQRFRKNPEDIYREYARAVAEGLARYYSQS